MRHDPCLLASAHILFMYMYMYIANGKQEKKCTISTCICSMVWNCMRLFLFVCLCASAPVFVICKQKCMSRNDRVSERGDGQV